MRLLIISNMYHYKRGDEIVGWGPTAQEIDHLSSLFDEIKHIACLHAGPAPGVALPYTSERVHVHLLPPAGGTRLRDKLAIVRLFPRYALTILKELREADVVHVRCPANISILAIVLLAFVPRPRLRWVKYAGNWRPHDRESWSYTFQRWWLQHGFHRGMVTVNGRWPDQPKHVHSFLNPCLTDEELEEAARRTSEKQLTSPLRLLYVGRLESEKGVGRAIEILSGLASEGLEVTLDLVGDGPERPCFEAMSLERGVGDKVHFHGWVPRPQLGTLYGRAHFLIFPASSSEGWPKVLSEAMAYGVVPLAGKISSIPQLLRHFGTGQTFPPCEVAKFQGAIVEYLANPERWDKESRKGKKAAQLFSYGSYLLAVSKLLKLADR